ncbi:MAG: hypothetical protein WBA91_06470 [Paracoccaceae bacterium]
MTIIPLLGALLHVAVSLSATGSILPLSGEVKNFYGHRFFEDVSASVAFSEEIRMWIKIQMVGVLGLVPENIADIGLGDGFRPLARLPHMLLAGVAAGSVMFGVLNIHLRLGWHSSFGRIAIFCATTMVLAALQSAVAVKVMTDFSHVSRHYYGLHLLAWLIWGAAVLMMVLEILPALLRKVGAAGYAAGMIACYTLIATTFLARVPGEENYAIARYRLTQELNQTLPANAIVAAWNAGLLGYFLQRPVVDLDGLVDDSEFLTLLEEKAPLLPYLQKTGVTHLIDHNNRDLTLKYREERNLQDEFRDGIRWDDLNIEQQRGAIYVLALKK